MSDLHDIWPDDDVDQIVIAGLRGRGVRFAAAPARARRWSLFRCDRVGLVPDFWHAPGLRCCCRPHDWMATVIAMAMINDPNHATPSIRLNIGSLSILFNTQKVLPMGTVRNGLRPPVA
jgi:hypothetical protein